MYRILSNLITSFYGSYIVIRFVLVWSPLRYVRVCVCVRRGLGIAYDWPYASQSVNWVTGSCHVHICASCHICPFADFDLVRVLQEMETLSCLIELLVDETA